MNMQVISKEDLMTVRQELLTEIQDLKRLFQVGDDQQYLKNRDVKKILGLFGLKIRITKEKRQAAVYQNAGNNILQK